MAVASNVPRPDPSDDDDEFDPFGPLELAVIVPVWRKRPAEIARDARVSYDRRSDTLHLHGTDDRGDTIVVQVESSRFVLVDRSTSEVVGFHIEGFLSRVLEVFPGLMHELERAELRGITRGEVESLRRRLGTRSAAESGAALTEAYADAESAEPVAV